jgi:hypothetical protein
MHQFARQIHHYLDVFRRGDRDTAFHGLLEMDRRILPELMAAFRIEHDIAVREFLVEIVWQSRDESIIPFLAEALIDPEPRIWRQALNGVVALASPAALDALRAARTRHVLDSARDENLPCLSRRGDRSG